MRALTLEIDGSALGDALSLVANALKSHHEVRVDDEWLTRHGCRVKPYERFRDAFTRELDAARLVTMTMQRSSISTSF